MTTDSYSQSYAIGDTHECQENDDIMDVDPFGIFGNATPTPKKLPSLYDHHAKDRVLIDRFECYADKVIAASEKGEAIAMEGSSAHDCFHEGYRYCVCVATAQNFTSGRENLRRLLAWYFWLRVHHPYLGVGLRRVSGHREYVLG